jgi:lipopolysaccharide transport system ATP-binding protein
MGDIVIRAEELGKKYRISHQNPERYTALRDVVSNKVKSIFTPRGLKNKNHSNIEDFWALRGVSFEIKRGEVVGIIGANGAGKSTLLKILSRITEPTVGRVELNGRVASLLEVGTGFHPELSGRENIYLNSAILGMKRDETKKKFDEIVAFAGVEQFLDTPVKRYSSGMYVRLAFAVAAHLEPEILIIDEVLAVGDGAFQSKCLGKMKSASRDGRTVLFVSHNMGAVDALTQSCILLEKGSIATMGESKVIINSYLSRQMESSGHREGDLQSYKRDRYSDSPVKIIDITVNGLGGDSMLLPAFELGTKLRFDVHLAVARQLQEVNLTLALKTSKGERVALLVSMDSGFGLSLDPGNHVVTAEVGNLHLSPGDFLVDVGIDPSVHAAAYDAVLDLPLFSIENNGQVIHWMERPWGLLHCGSVIWKAAHSHAGTTQ